MSVDASVADFDPLFDDETSCPSLQPATKPSFRLSLPTYERPAFTSADSHPRHLTSESGFFDIFNPNVGTIAPSGSRVSEHSSSLDSFTGLNSPSILPIPSTSSNTHGAKAGARKRVAPGRSPRNENATPSTFMPRSHREAVLYRLIRDPNVAIVLRALIDQMYKSKVLPDQFQSHLSALLGTFGQPDSPAIANIEFPRPAKRRRMDRIPAGAEDWIVPYPFQPDEAPEHFQEMRDIHILDSLLKSLERNVKSWKNARGVLNEPTRPRNAPSSNSFSPSLLSTTPNDAIAEDCLSQPNDELLLALDQLLGLPTHQQMDVEMEDPTTFASGLLESLGLMIPSVSESTASTSRLTTPVDVDFGADFSVFDGMDWSALENTADPKELEALPNDLSLFLDSLGSMTGTPIVATASPTSISSRGTTPTLDSRPTRLVPALSKRGRGRSMAVLRRQFNQKAASSSPGPSIASVGAETTATRGTRKMRASQETTKKREETLKRAREHREALAMELDRVRLERWEVLMEGVVLQEAAVLVTDCVEGSV